MEVTTSNVKEASELQKGIEGETKTSNQNNIEDATLASKEMHPKEQVKKTN